MESLEGSLLLLLFLMLLKMKVWNHCFAKRKKSAEMNVDSELLLLLLMMEEEDA